jgi:hypothetical protein
LNEVYAIMFRNPDLGETGLACMLGPHIFRATLAFDPHDWQHGCTI